MVVPNLGISSLGGVGFAIGIRKIGWLRAQFKATGKGYFVSFVQSGTTN